MKIYKSLAVLSLAVLSQISFAQNYDSTGTNRLFVTPNPSPIPETVPVPGYGGISEGAVIAVYSVKNGPVTTFYACVVKRGAFGGSPGGGPACPQNTNPMITASGVYHDGGGNDGG